MAKQTIAVGSIANDGTGDTLRVSFGKANANFTELYTSVATIPTDVNQLADTDSLLGGSASLGNFKISGSAMGTQAVEGNGWGGYDMYLSPNGEGNTWITIPSDLSHSNGAVVNIASYGADNPGVRISTHNTYWNFNNNGTLTTPTLTVNLHNGGDQTGSVLQFGNDEQQAIITGPTPAAGQNAQRLIVQGQKATGTGEGGDVYFWAGDAQLNGGDIKIYAGDADSTTEGYGGYVNIDAGNGYNQGGLISITAGNSDGDVAGAYGGDVTIKAGNAYRQAGSVILETGQNYNPTGANATLGDIRFSAYNVLGSSYDWALTSKGKFRGPITHEGTVSSLELETNLVMNRDRGFIVELGRFPHAIDGDDWWFDAVINKDGYVYGIGGSDIDNRPVIVKFDKYGDIVWQRKYNTTNIGVNALKFGSADWNASGNIVVYGEGFDITNDNTYIASFTVNPNNGDVTTPVGKIIRANDDVANIPNVNAKQIRYNADKTNYAMVGSKYGGDSLPLTISTSSAISITPGVLTIAKTSIVAAFGTAVPQTYNQAWGIAGYGFTGINNFTGVGEETTDGIEYYLLETDSQVDFSALPEGESWSIRFYDWSDALIITDDWVKSFDTGNEEDYFTSVAFDSDGNIYAGGSTGQISTNTGYTSLLVSTTSTGTIRWAKRIEDEEGSGFNYIQGITVDSDDYIYTVAYDDNGQTVITKLSSNGAVQWIKTMTIDDGMSSHYNSNIHYCSVDNTIVFALEYGSVSSYNDDFLLVKMGLDGSTIWANSFGSSSEENTYWNHTQDFLSVDDNYIYVSGSRYASGFDDNAILFAFPHDGAPSGWVGPYNVRNSINSLLFTVGATLNLSVSTLSSTDASTNLTIGDYTVEAADTAYEHRKVYLNGGYNKIKNVAEIKFADGSTQSTSGTDVPQSTIISNGNQDTHTINSSDRGKHILINLNSGSCNMYVPCHGDDPLPIGSVITLVLNEPIDTNVVYVTGNDNGLETVYIRPIGSDNYTNRYWVIGGDNVQGLYTLMKIDNNVWILSGSTIEVSGP